MVSSALGLLMKEDKELYHQLARILDQAKNLDGSKFRVILTFTRKLFAESLKHYGYEKTRQGLTTVIELLEADLEWEHYLNQPTAATS